MAIARKGSWRDLSSAQAAVIAAALAVVPALITGITTSYVTFQSSITKAKEEVLGERDIRERLAKQLPIRPGYAKHVYPQYGIGFIAPTAWIKDDAPVHYGIPDIDIVQRYTDQKAAIGVEFKLTQVQSNYVNDIVAEVRNQKDVWEKNDPKITVTDATLNGREAKLFHYTHSTGKRIGERRVYWVRLVPEIKLQLQGFTYTDEPDREEFWREFDRIVESTVIDQELIDRKRRTASQ
ncbi:MAG: hypothetical protein HWD57_15725 [Candidatus Accumulibacter cognatus]|uniref:Uncharacterized protein n=1 Tax=Candidatus Accumulibacter cognatus TaxID=2954383 RepID=A0A7D5SBM2_9PROT|nr:MAG: hypothetical protein HWD57_15725 [Candidatus Accumulibacter cognatus]